MTEKTLLILANSLKNAGRCIAGREIWLDGEKASLGCWIRPVSTHGKGELFEEECHYSDRTPLAVGDIARVKLFQPAPAVGQPENWVLPRLPGGPWRRIEHRAARGLAIEEAHTDLWPDTKDLTDRVSEEVIRGAPPLHSLCILRPEHLRLAFWSDFNPWKNREQKKYRARFRYNGKKYDLSLTDPAVTAAYCEPVPAFGSPQREVSVPGDPLMCVSLTPPYEGSHFKIVATVFV